MKACAVLSMLHESPADNSAARRFRGEPVLAWTLRRLTRATALGSIVILCWEDQLPALGGIPEASAVHVLAKGPRHPIESMEAVTASRKWADGWRGGLYGTCEFDRGFHGAWTREILDKTGADAAMLVDPAAALVDPALVDAIVAHGVEHAEAELVFSQAPAGLSGVLLARSLVGKLIDARSHPGRILCYTPRHPSHDPIAGIGCCAIPTAVARCGDRFSLDGPRSVAAITRAMAPLNGQLVSTEAEALVHRMAAMADASAPREATVEITARRETRAIFRPATYEAARRGEMDLESARRLFGQLAGFDELRVTFGGVGDPLLHPKAVEIIALARAAGLTTLHVETDFVGVTPETVTALVELGVDVVTAHLPAATAGVYREVMGVDGLSEAIGHVQSFVDHRRVAGRGAPLLAPTFVKCRKNMGEMEAWYDHWLTAVGAAVIASPPECPGAAAEVAVADMAPPRRSACRRLRSRMTVLSDGRFTSCEEDWRGSQSVGAMPDIDAGAAWRELTAMAADHRAGRWGDHPLCASCKGWHRP